MPNATSPVIWLEQPGDVASLRIFGSLLLTVVLSTCGLTPEEQVRRDDMFTARMTYKAIAECMRRSSDNLHTALLSNGADYLIFSCNVSAAIKTFEQGIADVPPHSVDARVVALWREAITHYRDAAAIWAFGQCGHGDKFANGFYVAVTPFESETPLCAPNAKDPVSVAAFVVIAKYRMNACGRI